jgi:hypothetical protein
MYSDVSGFQRNASPGISGGWFAFWIAAIFAAGYWAGYHNAPTPAPTSNGYRQNDIGITDLPVDDAGDPYSF